MCIEVFNTQNEHGGVNKLLWVATLLGHTSHMICILFILPNIATMRSDHVETMDKVDADHSNSAIFRCVHAWKVANIMHLF